MSEAPRDGSNTGDLVAPDVVVATPFDVNSSRGNSVSARRIGGLIEASGLGVSVIGRGDDLVRCGALVALHARRSRGVIEAFRSRCPGGKLVVVLTGSDVHIDLPTGGETAGQVLASMEEADVLVVAQAGSVASVPERFRGKLVVVPKSVDVDLPRWTPPGGEWLRVVVAAHLRPLKDPFRAVEALGMIGDRVRIQIDHYGVVEDGEMRARANWESARNARYRWHGEISREAVVAELGRCHIHLNTALMEGGANSVCEAIGIGVPVIATQIPGNIGMLGCGYAGYFDAEDTAGLARVLERCASERPFLNRLERQVAERSQLFTREAEAAGWAAVLAGV